VARAARRPVEQTLRSRLLLSAAAAAAVACANTGSPPGGPPDEAPPVILSVYPESGAVLPDVRGDAVIQFDEVIDEQGGGGSSLGGDASGLASRVLLSPTVGPVKVSWHRSSIHVKPKEGWKPGRVYQLQVLPGIIDLRRNIMKAGRTVVFSTGPEIPHAELSGVAVQWVEQRTLPAGLIRAARLPDSAAYLALTDSTGAFQLGNLPPGQYAVWAVADQNGNRLRDRREAYDSALVSVDSSTSVVLWTFVHDTIGPRLRQADPLDSVAATLTFSEALDPTLPLDSMSVRAVQLPDSTPVPVRALLTAAAYDSLTKRERAVADSIRAASDTTRPPRDTTPADTARADTTGRRAPRTPAADTSTASRLHALLAQRPVPTDKLVLRFDTVLTPGEKYYVAVRGARNLNGARADGQAVLVVPKPKPAPPPADSTRAPPDSSRQRPDSSPP
jgi:Bacterial Ig-like domain